MELFKKIAELRETEKKQSERESLQRKLKEQEDEIAKLNLEKSFLLSQLDALQLGENLVTENPRVEALQDKLNKLENVVAAATFIGPCGVTVQDVSKERLKLTFTAMYKDLVVENFHLTIRASDDRGFDLTDTNIPAFIDIDNVMKQDTNWTNMIQKIGFKLNALVHRRGALRHVQVKYKDILSFCGCDQAVSNVQLHIKQDGGSDLRNRLIKLLLSYRDPDTCLPTSVLIDLEGVNDLGNIKADMEKTFLHNNLDVAMETCIEIFDKMGFENNDDS